MPTKAEYLAEEIKQDQARRERNSQLYIEAINLLSDRELRKLLAETQYQIREAVERSYPHSLVDLFAKVDAILDEQRWRKSDKALAKLLRRYK